MIVVFDVLVVVNGPLVMHGDPEAFVLAMCPVAAGLAP